MAGRRPATMKDIAARVGVSKMTVSAVLGDNSSQVRVSEATRAKIVEAARQLDFRPNAIARSLRQSRTNIIGLYSGYRHVDPRKPFMAQVIGGLQEACAEHQKDLLLHTVFRGASTEDIYAELADGRIDGLVLTAPPEDPLARRLAACHLPVVVVADAVPMLPCVVVDDATAARLTFDHLIRKGHRQLVYRSVNLHVTSAERRMAAYFAVAKECELEMTEQCSPPLESEDDPFLTDWLARPRDERPTAAVCWSDLEAYRLLERCHYAGVRVPEDLAVVGFDGIANLLAFRLRLTTVRAPWAEVARTAVKLLVAQIEGDEIPKETFLPVEFVPGDTA